MNGEQIDAYTVTPEQLGVKLATSGEGLEGGDPAHSAAVTRGVLAASDGPARDLALVNAGALAEGVEQAREALDDSRAAATLEAFIRATHAAP